MNTIFNYLLPSGYLLIKLLSLDYPTQLQEKSKAVNTYLNNSIILNYYTIQPVPPHMTQGLREVEVEVEVEVELGVGVG